MRFTVVIVPILLPVLFWAGYHYYKDRHQPEPILNLLFCFLLGIAASYLSKYMYIALETVNLRHDAYELAATNLWQLLAYAIFIIGGIEETAKLIPFLIFAIRFKAFDENLDGIIYASFIALGYAAMENFHYLQYLTQSEAIYRGFAGPVVHILFASIWGFYIGVAHLQGKALLGPALGALAITALLHGIYDFVAIALPVTALPASALLMLGIWMWRMYLIRDLHSEAQADLSSVD